MKTYIFKITVIMLMLAGNISSCSEKSNNEIDPKEAILGKWELIADGSTENDMNKRTDGTHWEFLADGTAQTYLSGYFPAEGVTGKYIGIGSYSIDSDLLIRRYDSGTEDHYRYIFYKDKLKLLRANNVRYPENLMYYWPNVFIYQRIK